MAFCPNCGKPVTAQAIKCIACGKSLPAGKPQPQQRFKGTMLLTPAVPGTPQGGVPDAPLAAPPPAAAAPPAAAPAPAAPAAELDEPPGRGASSPSKLKATMIGTGVPDLASFAKTAAAQAAPAGAAQTASPASASSSPPSSSPAGAATVSEGAPAPDHALGDTAPRAAEAAATAPAAETRLDGRPAPKAPKVFTGDLTGPAGAARGQDAPPNNARALLTVALIGLLLIAATGYGMALYLGLL